MSKPGRTAVSSDASSTLMNRSVPGDPITYDTLDNRHTDEAFVQ
jgi:hypothetical protein